MARCAKMDVKEYVLTVPCPFPSRKHLYTFRGKHCLLKASGGDDGGKIYPTAYRNTYACVGVCECVFVHTLRLYWHVMAKQIITLSD